MPRGDNAGRPDKLAPDIADDVIASAELGLPQADCARAAGIHPDTLRRWLEEGSGDDGRPKYRAFFGRYEKAVAIGRRRNLSVIQGAAAGSRTICGECGRDLPPSVSIDAACGHKVSISTLKRPEWQAGAWLLERRDPANFSRRDRTAVTVEHTVNRDDVAALVRRMYELLQMRTRDLLALVENGDREIAHFLKAVREDWHREFVQAVPEPESKQTASPNGDIPHARLLLAARGNGRQRFTENPDYDSRSPA
jgi:hypothetical protein